MLGSQDGSASEGLEAISAQPYLICYLVWAFPICYELIALFCACYSLYAAKDKISDLDRVKLDSAIMEPCDAEFALCLPKECITSDKGKELNSFPQCCIVKFLFECGKVMCVECYLNR